MRLTRCENHKGTFMLSNENLVSVLPALLSEPEVSVWKIERCDAGGWHVYTKNTRREKVALKNKED